MATVRDQVLEQAARILSAAREYGSDELEDITACLLTAANRI